MKITRLLATMIILSGVIVLGIGLMQLWDIKRQEQNSLDAARELVQVNKEKGVGERFQPENGEATGLDRKSVV